MCMWICNPYIDNGILFFIFKLSQGSQIPKVGIVNISFSVSHG